MVELGEIEVGEIHLPDSGAAIPLTPALRRGAALVARANFGEKGIDLGKHRGAAVRKDAARDRPPPLQLPPLDAGVLAPLVVILGVDDRLDELPRRILAHGPTVLLALAIAIGDLFVGRHNRQPFHDG